MTPPDAPGARGSRDPFPLGVVGLGKMGILHAAMACVVPGARLAAVCDADRKLAGHVAGLGIRAPFFTSVEAMLDQAAPAGVVVSTPQFAHAPVALACVERGVGVLCEKPLAHSLDEARAMLRAGEQHPGVPTATAFMVGHYPIYGHVSTLLADGAIGSVERYEARMFLSQVFSAKKGWIYTKSRSGGGVLANSGAHPLYVLKRWFGLPEAVQARCVPVHSHEVEDRAELVLRHASGIEGSLLADWSVRGYPTQYHEFTIHGSRGRIAATDRTLECVVDGGRYAWHEADFPQPAFNLTPHYGGSGFYLQMADFAACLRGERERPLVTWRDGFEVNAMLDAAYRSSATGGEAVAPEAAL